jgi:hypothetical protein
LALPLRWRRLKQAARLPVGPAILKLATQRGMPMIVIQSRGRYANNLLERLALRARAKKLGLWGRCPHTPYDPIKGVSTRR